MSPSSRRGSGGKRDKGGWRRRRDEVSIADRLGPPGKGGAVPPGSVLPGQDKGQDKGQEKGRDKGRGKERATEGRETRDQRGGNQPPNKQQAPGTVLPGKRDAAPVRQQTRKQLREQREAQKRQERQRWILTALAVVAVVAIGVVLVIWLSGRGSDEPTAAGPERVERTLTMTLAADNEAATSGALMVNDPVGPGAASVLVPSQLFVEGPTPDGLPFGDTVLLGDDAAPGTALADTLDVIVDDTWQVSDDVLAKLVDDVGGVLVDVDSEIVRNGQVVLTQGDDQLLKGNQAVVYATYLGNGEVEEARLARFGDVLDQLMQRLPENSNTLVNLIEQAGAVDNATLSADELATFLLEYGDVARGGDATYQSLPTTVLNTVGNQTALTVDPAGLERLRDGLLADSLPPDAGGDQVTVLVQNGVGTPGLEQDAADLLRDDGFDFLNGGNANEFGVKQTVVFVPDSTPASQTLGQDVAKTLGVPASAVEVSDQGSSVADVIVVLGEDFKP
ncbi:MAG TPA: LytR C-terminal domain-containing protein [Actinomycetes bacterium]|nr:LytR C-terminal domain-containing protein [Actinomycetes bacterium]